MGFGFSFLILIVILFLIPAFDQKQIKITIKIKSKKGHRAKPKADSSRGDAEAQRKLKTMILARYRAKGYLAGCGFKGLRFSGEAEIISWFSLRLCVSARCNDFDLVLCEAKTVSSVLIRV